MILLELQVLCPVSDTPERVLLPAISWSQVTVDYANDGACKGIMMVICNKVLK